MTDILQLNIRGLQANKEELDMLLSHTHPSIVSLQQTFLKKNKVVTLKVRPIPVTILMPQK